ncbi:MAG TPA: metallophosphoesterase [Candidatus Moranbacteria bacterium]|nr:metallophosphoesterase [Candidatus Moranbacteria bacterium]
MSNKKIIIILLIILALGAFLRFWKLDQQPFVTDEFLDINATYGYFKTGEWVAWDFNLDQVSDNLYAPREERAWIYRAQVAQLFHFFPLTEATARSVSALWGVFSIIILYFVSTYFTKNKTIGLISAFLFAVSIAGITFDRMLRMYAMFFPVFLLFSWFLFRFFEEEYAGKVAIIKFVWNKFGINLKWFLPATFFGLLSFHLHPLTLNIGVVFGVYLIIQSCVAFYQKRTILNKYTAILFLTLLGLIAAYINNSQIYSFYSKKDLIAFDHARWRYLQSVASDYINVFLAYGLIFFGFYELKKNIKIQKESVWLVCCFLAIIFSAVFFWNEVFGLRFIFFAMSFGIILLSSGIYFLAEKNGKYFPAYQKKVFVGVLMTALLIVPNYGYFFSKESPYRKDETKTDYRASFQYFLDNKNEDDSLLTRNFRSFYYKNAKAKIINKEWNKKISLDELKKIMTENPSGWIVTGDPKGDMEKDALKYIEENSLDKKEIGGVQIYHWSNKEFQITIATDLHAGKEPIEGEGYDPRKWKEKLDYLMGKSTNSKFIVMAGDNQQSPNYEIADLLKDYEKQSGKDFIWVNGNHDGDIYISNQKHYYIDYNDWRMIVLYNLDPSDDYDCAKVDEEQMVWLESILKTDKKKIVFLHCPVFSNGNGKKEVRDRYKELTELFNNNSVAYVYSGHWHTGDFRTKIDNVEYRVLLQLDSYGNFYDILKLE